MMRIFSLNKSFILLLLSCFALYVLILGKNERIYCSAAKDNSDTAAYLTAAEAVDSNSSWYKEVTKKLSDEEYNIHYQEKSNAYESPNRINNLRITYKPGKVSMITRIDSLKQEKWKLELNTNSITFDNSDHYYPSQHAAITTKGDTIEFKHGNLFTEQYINNAFGIRQNFIIHRAPKNNIRNLHVKMTVSGDLTAMKVHPREVHFAEATGNGGWSNKIIYKDLKAWDATGKILEAEMQAQGDELCLLVNTVSAVFPIIVDPVSTTADSQLEANQSYTYFGFIASSAGDVNADGYSDVIVGAVNYDNGQSYEGRAFIYHGSATGISTSASTTVESNQASANMGNCATTAGDVNGDGYSDVIVTAYLYDNGQTDEGTVFIYHGSASGITTTIRTRLESNQAGALFGVNAMCAGDVNGDGYSDVIVGARLYTNGQTDEGAAFVYHGSASGITTTIQTQLERNQASSEFGYSIAGAGDVNGDGYSDVIVGAKLYDNGQTNEGAAFVYHGSASGITTTVRTQLECNQAGADFGRRVASAGDVNGDGYSDVIVGADWYTNGQTDEGAAFIYHGSASGITTTLRTQLECNQASANFGFRVSSAGDVNGDGYSDVIVGAELYDNGQSNEGAAFVYHGSASGITTTVQTQLEANQANADFGIGVGCAGDVNGDGYSDVIVGADTYTNGHTNEGAAFVYLGGPSGLNNTAGSQMECNQANSNFGKCVASAGDVNRDGYSDVIVGAEHYDNGQTDEGAAFIYHGSASGLSTSVSTRLESNQAGAEFGNWVASAGDVNGDGYSDVIIGAPLYTNGQTDEGAAFVYHGSGSGISTTIQTQLETNQANANVYCVASAGDVNGDGFSDVIVGSRNYDNGHTDEGTALVYEGSASGVHTDVATRLEINQTTANFGYSVSSAGDVNGDGYGDVIVGAGAYDNSQSNEGAAFVYHGSLSGLSTTISRQLERNQSNANFGSSVASAGDVDGDGYSDVIVGAYSYDNGSTDEGGAFIYHGSASGITSTLQTQLEINQTDAHFGFCVASAGDVNGDGYSDIIVSCDLYNNGQTDEGGAFVYLGSPSGVGTGISTRMESNQTSANFGINSASAGDVNGDGYSDVVVGAHGYDNGQSNEGGAFIFYGNNEEGKRNNLRLYNTDLSTPITQNNKGSSTFGAGLFAKSFIGRVEGRLVWEVKGPGSSFSDAGGDLSHSVSYTSRGSFTDLGTAGTELKSVVTKAGRSSKIRVRIAYDKVTAITGQIYGPWIYSSAAQAGMVSNSSTPLPIVLFAFEALKADDKVKLNWQTATESNNDYFTIEKSQNGTDWTLVNKISGAGNSNLILSYTSYDEQPFSGVSYYRLKQTDYDGKYSYSKVIPVEFLKPLLIQIFPNPAVDKLTVQLHERTGKVIFDIYDQKGQKVLSYASESVASASQSIPVASLSAGAYYVALREENKSEHFFMSTFIKVQEAE